MVFYFPDGVGKQTMYSSRLVSGCGFRRVYQRGQAMVYLIALLVFMCLGVTYVYNSNILVTDKMKVQNAADAVAYSMSTVEARHLNFMAYTNRAMVANQVAIGQAVSFLSWSRWFEDTARVLKVATSWIPGVNSATELFAEAAQIFASGAEPILDAAIVAQDVILTLLENAQFAMQAAAMAQALEVAREVAEAHDPKIETGLDSKNLVVLQSFTRAHNNLIQRFDPDPVRQRQDGWQSHKARMDQFRNITMGSRDGFARDRTYEHSLLKFAGVPTDFALFKVELWRTGGADLVGGNSRAPYGGWIAMDTLALGVETRTGCGGKKVLGVKLPGFKPCPRMELGALPEEVRDIIGSALDDYELASSGAAKSSRDGETLRFDQHRARENVGEGWHINPNTSDSAARKFQSSNMQSNNGLRKFYDLQLSGLVQRGPGIQVLLTKPISETRTARRLGANAGAMDLETEEDSVGDNVNAIAASEVYFARVNDKGFDTNKLVRGDGRREYGNLYNPYWQPRLRALTETERKTLQLAAEALE